MKIVQINSYQNDNYKKSRQPNFGKVIEIQKAIIDGIDSHDVMDIRQAARNLGNILLKTKDAPNGKSIRSLIGRMTCDYRCPKTPVDNSRTPIFEMHMGTQKQYVATGKEAKSFFDIGYWRWKVNHDVADGRMPESCLKDIEPGGALDQAVEKIVASPESQIPNGKKLVLHGKRVPIESEYIRSLTGKDTEVKLTDISFV